MVEKGFILVLVFLLFSLGFVSALDEDSVKIRSWMKIAPGEARIWNLNDVEFAIKQISIEITNHSQNVRITVTKYNEKPAEVSVEKSGGVYRYLQIKDKNLKNVLNKSRITLQVRKTWMQEYRLGKDKIALFKFNNNTEKWDELPTIFKEEGTTHYEYDVELTSFSYFAIAEKTTDTGEGTTSQETASQEIASQETASQETPSVDTTIQETITAKITNIDKSEEAPWGSWIIIVIAIAIVAAGIIYFSQRKKKWF